MGSLQLSLYGAADQVLTGNPEITFFRHVWRRPTPFSIEEIQQSWSGIADFGRQCSCIVSRVGDLCRGMWLELVLPDLSECIVNPESSSVFVVSARRTGPTSSMIRVQSQVGYTTYTATLSTDGGGASIETVVSGIPVSGQAALVDIAVTGLSPSAQYTATVTATGQGVSNKTETLPVISLRYCDSVGFALLQSVELEIGSVRIDSQSGEFMDVYANLTMREEKLAGFNEMVGTYHPSYDLHSNSFWGQRGRTLYVPAGFFYCFRSPALALPIISLAYHDCRLNFRFRDLIDLVKSDNNVLVKSLMDYKTMKPPSLNSSPNECRIYGSFVYLDVQERRKYSQIPAEYLIEQVQFVGDTPVVAAQDANSLKISLPFSHPVKELLWTYQHISTYEGKSTTGNTYFDYDLPSTVGTRGEDPFSEIKLSLNGHDRQSPRPGSMHRLMNAYLYHTRIPSKKIYGFSFSLNPEESSPSGSCNWSRLDTAHLVVKMHPDIDTGRIRVYAISHNVLRCANGMAGLAFTG